MQHQKTVDLSPIIGIGMHATGTRSLCVYLRSLGYRSLHWPEDYERDIGDNIDAENTAILKLLIPLFAQYDVLTDVPFPGLFRELDQQFPQARFILTTRNATRWWRSVVRLWKLDRDKIYRLTPGEKIQYRQYEPHDKVDVSLDDGHIQIAKFNQHNAAVAAHFVGRDQKLLVLDVEDPDKNIKISEFLGMPIKAYPHLNARSTQPTHTKSREVFQRRRKRGVFKCLTYFNVIRHPL